MNKFDAAIDRLYASIDDSGREYGSRWVGKINSAIHVLEAAANYAGAKDNDEREIFRRDLLEAAFPSKEK